MKSNHKCKKKMHTFLDIEKEIRENLDNNNYLNQSLFINSIKKYILIGD